MDQLDNRVDETLVMLRAAAIEQGMAVSGDDRVGESCAAKLLGLECESLAKRRQEGKAPLVAQLADLLGRLRTSDDRIEYMNAHALPRG
jgi:hypothetical protein